MKEGAVPYAIHTARRVPLPFLPKVQKELERMEEHGVIEKVTQPTDWCAPMVPVMKNTGAVRICVELQKLNENLRREKYQMPTTDETLAKLSASTDNTHDKHLQDTLERMGQARLKLNKDKCVCRKAELQFLGHNVDASGVRADPREVSAISELKAPTNVHELKCALGITNYISKFLKGLASTAGPLYELLKEKNVWTCDQQHSKD